MVSTADSKRLLRALRGEALKRPPFWLMRQAGRYLPEYREVRKKAGDFLELCYTPKLAVEVTLQPLRRYGMDAAILFSDILVIPDALGQSVRFEEGEGPILEPLTTRRDVERLEPSRIDEHLAPVFETVKRLAVEIPKDTALIGFAGAPWTVAVYMIEGRGGSDFAAIRGWSENRPDDFQHLIDVLVDATSAYLSRQVEAGAEAIQLFDSWAGVLDDTPFGRWVIEPTRRIVDSLKARHPDVPVIGFPRGAGALAVDYVKETGVDGVSLDQTMALAWIRDTLQPLCTVQGNLDNEILVAGGETLDATVLDILETLSAGPFIFNLGHGILQTTPPEHVRRVAELVKGWPGTDTEDKQ